MLVLNLQRFTLVLSFLVTLVSAWTRIDKDNVALVIVDHQLGLFTIVRDQSPGEFWNNVLAHAELGKIFNLPTVITSSAEDGPNGPIPEEITNLLPNATIVRRPGEVNAWDNEEFRNAIKATGKQQIIIAGITTDVCTAFCALSLVAEGYTVFANADASGAFSAANAQSANERMRNAGVHVLSAFSIASDLMRDWRSTPGFVEMMPYFSKYYPSYGNLARVHSSAGSA